MADTPADPDVSDGTGAELDHGSTADTPRWVKVFGVITLAVVALLVVLLVIGGSHNPGRHSGGAGGHTPSPGSPRHLEQ